MDTIGVRELQQHASAALRRVERGETLGVTDRGRLVAVLTSPSTAGGTGALLATGRVLLARRPTSELGEPAPGVRVAGTRVAGTRVAGTRASGDILDALREDR